ncbi:hypothetical protein D9M70_393260 [compost metagenome]
MSRFSLSDKTLVMLQGQLKLNGTFQHCAKSAYSRDSLIFKLKVEQAAQEISATVMVGGERHSLTLAKCATDNHHTLADFIDAIANGTVDTAIPALPRITTQPTEPEPLLSTEQEEQLRYVIANGGFLAVDVGLPRAVELAVHRTYNRPGITTILAIGNTQPRTVCFTSYEEPQRTYQRMVDSIQHLADAGRPKAAAA